MNKFECSMQKKKESLCSKKNKGECSMQKKIESLTAKKSEATKVDGIKSYQQRLSDMGFKPNSTGINDAHDYVLEIGKIPGATVYVGTIAYTPTDSKETNYEAELYMANDKGVRSNIEYMPFAITDISDGMQRKMYFNHLNSLIKKGTDFIKNHESSESKKSEAENPKDVIGDELAYGLMQYRDEDTKEWLPILVSINYNDRGWFYEGLAPSDNFGNFSYEEFNRGFLKTCKPGTDKCDQELVNSMKKFFTDASMDIDKMPTKEVTNLTAYIPKGKPYIGKE